MIENLDNEEWRPIKGYEGLYEVSNQGRIKSLPKIKRGKNNSIVHRKEQLLKPCESEGHYSSVNLHKDGIQKTREIHRLVAETFIPNPSNLPCVNHKDETKRNNCVDNLEWCTAKYNANYGTALARAKEKLTNNPNTSKEVLQIDKYNNEVINVYPSAREAARTLNLNGCWNIVRCCNKIPRYNTAYGYRWRYA